jgi:hypothetical protein
MNGKLAEMQAALAAPFPLGEVKFKPGKVSGDRAMALAYVDARAIQDRLDEVVGSCGWQDSYECLPDGSVICKLQLRLDGEWLAKMDVGAPSEQPDEGDRRKAAFSDALKRAAVKFGIGRYLYRLGPLWVDFDPQKKKFATDPGTWKLPPGFLPAAPGSKTQSPAPAGAAAAKPAAKPGVPPRPDTRGKDAAELLGAEEMAYLRHQLRMHGKSEKKLLEHYTPEAAEQTIGWQELTIGQYREAMGYLTALPAPKAGVSS